MIVKVQLSLESNAVGHTPGSRMLVYNKSRSVQFETDADVEVVEKMKGRPKAYFHATKDEHAPTVKIQDEAPWQDW
jgi:hypothetical protein